MLILTCADYQNNSNGCTVKKVDNGSEISCSDGSSVLIKDGKDGVNGNAGEDGIDGKDGKDSVTKIIDPCGPYENGYDEILICFNDGRILAYFEDKTYRHLSLITEGSYITTDEQKCRFDVIKDGNIVYLDGTVDNCNSE